jgi:glyoxylase-like metal-dependent hydrolase (beta-lactamase superfamily II)
MPEPDSCRYRWTLLRAGRLLLDGGGMFGLVPKVVWGKTVSTDDRNRITLHHNCLLLRRLDDSRAKPVVIETGTGNKADEKMRDIFGLEDRSILDAVKETGTRCEDVGHVIVSHLHFDHAGGLTRLLGPGESPDWVDPKDASSQVRLTFPNATVIVQQREWEDALANKSVMTRTYFPDHLEPIRHRLRLVQSPPPFAPHHVPRRDELPESSTGSRMSEVLPGIKVFLVPGHTWGQQAVAFCDEAGQTVVFTPDVMPTAMHVGAAYNLAYDVEPYTSMITRHWFLKEAAEKNWLLLLDHEPGNPLYRVEPDGRGWFRLASAANSA